jgi:hypothetical protein
LVRRDEVARSLVWYNNRISNRRDKRPGFSNKTPPGELQ